ncbi:hypothetical protein ONZ45_g6163 [Pleurotus djamor]|nr:hypothetical protein ONZ45_g6163 [Pleurotus djamor]
MRPAFVLFAIAAAVVARPATSDAELINHLKQTGELDTLLENAFQGFLDEVDGTDGKIFDKIKSVGSSIKKAADDAGVTDALKEVGAHALEVGKTALKEAATDVIKTNVAHHAEKLKPGAKRSVDEVDQVAELAAQEWIDKQDEATLNSLVRGALLLNALD